MVGGIHKKIWWNQNQHLLAVTAEILQNHHVQVLHQPRHQKGKHNLFTHVPKDPHCEICKRTKATRAACRRYSQSHVLRPTKFGETNTVDHKGLSLKKNNRGNSQGYAIVVQDLAIHGFKAARVKREETATMFTKVYRCRRKSKSFEPPTIHLIRKSLWRSSMEPVYVYSLSAGDTRKCRKSSEKSQRRHFICFNVIDCDIVLTGACWMRANSWLVQLVSRDERASTTHLGNPPPRRLVDDSGQGTGDAGRITVVCEHQFNTALQSC